MFSCLINSSINSVTGPVHRPSLSFHPGLVPLVLTGIAVAFAFRCGMFNIGGQGQYLAGAIVGVIVAAELPLRVDS